MPPSPPTITTRADPAARAAGEDRRQCLDPRHGRLRRPRRADRPDRAGFGSFLGNLLRLRPAERRILMAAGMGAGVAAIFRAPLAGALFAAEVLYRSPDFESEVIIPAGLASVIAYCTFGLVIRLAPLFTCPPSCSAFLRSISPLHLVAYTSWLFSWSSWR